VLDAYASGANDLLLLIVYMIHSLKYRIVIEGVESEEMAREVAEMGCEYLQGYYYAKPVPSAKFAQFVARFNCVDVPQVIDVPVP
jgi:EAL domain-containing protein (putative c-di-GMP-specific phosphodiesterase class I)